MDASIGASRLSDSADARNPLRAQGIIGASGAAAAKIRCRSDDSGTTAPGFGPPRMVEQATLSVRTRPGVSHCDASSARAASCATSCATCGSNLSRTAHIMNQPTPPLDGTPRHTEADETNVRALVEAFYRRVDDDPLLGPVFARELTGRWDEHLAKMTTFWSQPRARLEAVSRECAGGAPAARRHRAAAFRAAGWRCF